MHASVADQTELHDKGQIGRACDEWVPDWFV